MKTPRDPSKDVADDLAAQLCAPGGLRTARLLQSSRLFADSSQRDAPTSGAPAADADDDDALQPIGIWAPEGAGDDVVFRRPAPLHVDESWSLTETIAKRKAPGARRVVLIGESVAVGMFFSPGLRFADVLRAHLGDGYEVVDLARLGTTGIDLVLIGAASLQLDPDAIIVFAGNNWTSGDADSLAIKHANARALRAGGASTLASAAKRSQVEYADVILADIAAVAEAAGVPTVLVVPEVNLGDWHRKRSPVWLAGDGSLRWHALYAEGLQALSTGDGASAAARATELQALDEHACPASWRLLGEAKRAAGDIPAARRAFEGEVEADAAATFETARYLSDVPGVTRAVQARMRASAERHGLRCVDLPAVFAAQSDGALPDRRFFFDYCHHTLEGMQVAAGAIAAEIAAAFGTAARRPEEAELGATSTIRAKAAFEAAIHVLHRNAPLDRGHALAVHWCEAAVDADASALDAMVDFLAARTAPGRSILSTAHARLEASPYRMPMAAWLQPGLDAPLIDVVAGLLERHRGAPARAAFEEALFAHHDVARRPQDLLEPFNHLHRYETYPAAIARATEKQLFRAIWPASTFWFLADAAHDLELVVTARSAAGGACAVLVNDARCDSVSVSARWARSTLRVPKALLRRGGNQVTLGWPALRPVGDAAMTDAVVRLEEGVDTGFWPVFGELFTLRARGA